MGHEQKHIVARMMHRRIIPIRVCKPESSTFDESMDEVSRKTKKGGSTDYQTRHAGTRKVYVQSPFTRTDIDSQSAWVKEFCIP